MRPSDCIFSETGFSTTIWIHSSLIRCRSGLFLMYLKYWVYFIRGGPRNSDNRVRWKNDCRRRRPRDEEKQTEPVFGGVQGQGGDGGAPGGGDAFRAVLPIRCPPESDHEMETAGGRRAGGAVLREECSPRGRPGSPAEGVARQDRGADR